MNEFRPSLNINIHIFEKLDEDGRKKYHADLVRRRSLAHQREDDGDIYWAGHWIPRDLEARKIRYLKITVKRNMEIWQKGVKSLSQ